MIRVQIPAYTDRWMMGDRFGDLIKVTRYGATSGNRIRAALLTNARYGNKAGSIDIAHVKLDISGKTVKVILDDCTMV